MVKIGANAENKPPETSKNGTANKYLDVQWRESVIRPSDFVYSICKENVNNFQWRTTCFLWANSFASTILLITVLLKDIPLPNINLLTNHHLMIIIHFLLYLIVRKLLSSDAHMRFFYNSAVQSRERIGLSIPSRNANYAKFSIKAVFLCEILYLSIPSVGITYIIACLYGFTIKEAEPVEFDWTRSLPIPVCLFAFLLLIIVSDGIMRNIFGRNIHGEMKETNSKGDTIEKRSQVLSTFATHFAIVYGLDDIQPAGSFMQGIAFFCILSFPGAHLASIGVISQDDIIELSFFSILKCLAVMFAGFLIFLLIQTVIHILSRRSRTVRIRKGSLEEIEGGQGGILVYGIDRPSFVVIIDADGLDIPNKGFRRGDQIISVNGVNVNGLSISEITQLFKFTVTDFDTVVVQYQPERAIHIATRPFIFENPPIADSVTAPCPEWNQKKEPNEKLLPV